MVHAHGALWGHISPLDMDVGYCGAVPPMAPLWDIVNMFPMTLGYRVPGSSATPFYIGMEHPAAVPPMARG